MSVLDVLKRHLPSSLKPSGETNVLTKCPFHKGGNERKPSFSTNLSTGVSWCFTCNRAWSLKQLLTDLGVPESASKAELSGVYEKLKSKINEDKFKKANTFKNEDPFLCDNILPETVQGAFNFEPTLLKEKGFDLDLLHNLGVGYDLRQHRIMYPIRDMYGNLAGYSGGITPQTPEDWPKYKIYKGKHQLSDGTYVSGDFGEWFDEMFPEYRIKLHNYLWNLHNVVGQNLENIIIVEGFKACLWLIQAGYPNTVALMGSSMSERQQQLIHRLGCEVILFLDNDDAGRSGQEKIAKSLFGPLHGRVKCVIYPESDINTQPDNYTFENVTKLINDSKSLFELLKSKTRKGITK